MMAPRSCAAATPRTSPTRSQSRMASVMEPIASGSRLTMYCSWPSASSMRARAADSSSPRSSANVRKATASVCEPARAASSAARAAYRLVRDRSCAASAWCVSTAWSLDRTCSSASSSRRVQSALGAERDGGAHGATSQLVPEADPASRARRAARSRRAAAGRQRPRRAAAGAGRRHRPAPSRRAGAPRGRRRPARSCWPARRHAPTRAAHCRRGEPISLT